MTGYRALARNHDFTVLWVGQTLSELGSRVSMFVFPLLGYALTGSALVAALAEALHLLGLVGALLPAGVLADRVDRRRMMRAASAAGLVLYASLVVAGLAGVLTAPHLLTVALLTGACAGALRPRRDRGRTHRRRPTRTCPPPSSQQQARQHVAGLVGGPLGGALYAVDPLAAVRGRRRDLRRSAGCCSAGSAPTCPRPQRKPDAADRSTTSPTASASSCPGRSSGCCCCWAPLANLMVNAVFFVAVLRLIESGVDPLALGLVETAAGACGILGALVAPWLIDRFATGRLTVVVAWSFVPLMVPLVFWNHPAVVALALAVGVFLNPAGNAGIGAYRVAVTPRELIARAQATMQFASMSIMPLAPVLAGVLLSTLGGARAVAVLVALCALVALIPTLSRSVRAVPRPADWPTTPIVHDEFAVNVAA